MIRFSLKCGTGHGFDSWFTSGATFDKLCASGMVACPVCGNTDIVKALMTPGVSTVGKSDDDTTPNALAEPPVANALSSPPSGALAREIAALRTRIESETENVGDRFVDEARAIHAGDAPERAIRGNADARAASKLIDEGIPILRLPFGDPKKAN